MPRMTADSPMMERPTLWTERLKKSRVAQWARRPRVGSSHHEGVFSSARASEETVKHNVILEIQQTYADLVSARESIEAATVLLQEARENLALAQGRYEVGVGPLIDVTDAQLALTQAESQDIQARVNVKRAEARCQGSLPSAIPKSANGSSGVAKWWT